MRSLGHSYVLASLCAALAACGGGNGTTVAGPPDTVIDTMPSALTNQRSFSFTFHGTPAAGTSSDTSIDFTCSLDGATADRCTSPVAVNVADGDHTFVVTALTEGQADASPATASWHVDSTAPDTMVTSGPPSFDNSSTTMITFVGTPAADVAKFECSLDAAAFADCTSPATLANLVSGLHTFKVRAVDSAGNDDPTPAQHSWTLDTTTPDTMITMGPAMGAVLGSSASFSFTSTLGTAVFECSFDGGSFTACVSPTSYDSLPGGSHTFAVRAKNTTTNVVDPTPAMRTWTVDGTAPVVMIDTTPADPTNQTVAMFTFSSMDTDVAGFECQIDGVAPFAACTSPFTTPTLAEGLQTFRVRVTDTVGNASTSTYSWTVDTTPPQLVITSGPSGNISTKTATFTFSATGATTVQCKLDSAAFATCTSPTTLTNLADGPHTFTIQAFDAATNMATVSRNFNVTTVGPTVTITGGPTGPTSDNTPTFTFTTVGATIVECRFDGTGAFASCVSPFTAQALAEGPHTFEVRGTDTASNQTTATRSFTVDTLAPTVTILTGPNGPTNNASPTFTFLTGGSPTATECRFDANAFAACTTPFVTNPPLSQGAHTFEVRVTDAAANTGNDTRSFTVQTTGPTVVITAGPTGPTNGNKPSWTFTTAGNPTTVQCKVDAAAFAACTSPFTSAQLLDGTHTFTVQVSDAANNMNSDSRTIMVDTIAPTVTITSGPSGPTNVSMPTFTFSTAGTPLTIDCRIDGGLFATCTSPFTQASALSDASHTFEVKVTDAAGNFSNATRTFTVDTSGPTVTITNTTPPPSDNTPTFTFTTTGAPTTVECAIDTGTYAACTSPFTSSPLGGGAHVFHVQVADDASNTAMAMQSFTIDSTAPTVAITSGPNGSCPTTATCNPTNIATPSFAFNVGANWTTIQCHIDANALTDCHGSLAVGTAGTGLTFASVPTLSSGGHSFEVVACNASSNCSSDIKAFTVDVTPPTLTLGGPSGLCSDGGSVDAACGTDPISPNTPAFTFVTGGSPVTSDFQCGTIAGTGPATVFGACNSTTGHTVTAQTPDGTYTFSVKIRDAAYNFTTVSKTFRVDTVAPTITFGTNPTTTGTNNNKPTLVYTVTDPLVSGVSDLATGTNLCSTDSGAFTATNCGAASATNPSALSDNLHTLAVSSRDTAGNVGTSTTYSYLVDTTSPTVTITAAVDTHGSDALASSVANPKIHVLVTDTKPVGTTTTAAITVTCTFVPVAPSGSNVSCQNAGGGAVTTSMFLAGVDVQPTATLAKGTYKLQINATDAATNTSGTIEQPFYVDLDNPVVASLVFTPASPNKAVPTLTFTVSDPTPGVLDTVLCSTSGAAVFGPTSCAGGSFAPALTVDGLYTYQVVAKDKSGRSTPQTMQFFYDTTAPTITAITGATLTAPTKNPSQTFTFSVNNPGGGPGAITTTCDFDGTAASCPTSGNSFPQTVSVTPISALTDGTHTLHITAVDAAGNTSAASSTAFIVDLVAPVVAISTPTAASIINNKRPTFTFSVTDNHLTDPSSYVCLIDGVAQSGACTSPFTPSADLAEGSRTYSITAKDLAGNAAVAGTSVLSVTFIVDTTTPTVTIDTSMPSNTLPTMGTTASFTFHGNDANGVASAQCDPGTGTFGACTGFTGNTSNANAAGTLAVTGLGDGPHTVRFKVTDRTNPALTSNPASYTFTLDNTPPTISAVTVSPSVVNGPTTYVSALSASATVTATDAISGTTLTYTCAIDSGTAGPCTSLTFTEGAHTLNVVATDEAGNDSTTFSKNVTVDSITPVIAVTSPTEAQVFTTAPTTAAITLTEANPDVQQCKLNSGAATACTTSFSIASSVEGPNTLLVTATDKAGHAATAVSRHYTVDTLPPASPTISGADTDKANTPPTYTFSATDVGSAMTAVCKVGSTTETCSTTPGGSAGAFTISGSYTPSALVQGPNTITVDITDSNAHTTTLTRIVTYDNVGPTRRVRGRWRAGLLEWLGGHSAHQRHRDDHDQRCDHERRDVVVQHPGGGRHVYGILFAVLAHARGDGGRYGDRGRDRRGG